MGASGTDSFLARPRRKMFLVDFAVKGMVMGIFSGSAPFSLQHVRELPEFASLMSLDRRKWPRCLLWHGWSPGLSGVNDSEPWASSFGDLACSYLEGDVRYLVVLRTAGRREMMC